MSHVPVLLDEVLHALEPRDGALYIDGTFGAGGYSRAILSAANCRVLGIDRDPNVRPVGEDLKQASGGRFVLVEAPFSAMKDVVRQSGGETVDGIVLDLGVSSMQLDQAERGFSFSRPGPLDMRMSGKGPSAADAVAQLSEKELADIFFIYGDEKKSRRVASFIVRQRAEVPFETTDQLAETVARAIGGKPGKTHPATRVFQALRIFVNDEMGELVRALHAAEELLSPLGRVVIVTFHSLEDRIVKTFFRARAGMNAGGSRHMPEVEKGPEPSLRLLTRKAIEPSREEVNVNPRARSARLRAAIRTDAPAWPGDISLFPNAPSLDRLEASS
ncbi:16S rRNA (cytosine(1402)-N(4))-methyltransferase RsmH [Hyphobacterium sp. HN65]|uniref:Ribosomal RNA small subunit methyltransferase H n=1 Tax=Hyphobacterium lacteum TaxID=3116575 RepID=A0ABU7LRW4_9PROT|nr:16S rRNA (cytosine(1402)-N(4))-methyltransferase RsmH [Hyphobacterium sp. HN65]MEE2526329.1 16S rRNA (cytosine(1402)-N(4))-methyltransferase RsmH [Hyphobacterium sp. HN65]